MITLNQNNLPFIKRFLVYQKERFPFIGHGILVASFSFSAISYSRICRGETGFIEWQKYLVAIFTTITLFFLVRIFDEFKDAEDDAAFRKELPVPRGLISFKELFLLGTITVILQIAINAIFYPKMLLMYIAVIVYLCLMGKEFFVHTWLKKHQFWYVVSHMMIIPLIDVFASGFDWYLNELKAPGGLFFFFAVSFMNGVVLEIGRKIKAPEKEANGVLTYSSMLGTNNAVYLWIIILFATLGLSISASFFAGYGLWAMLIMGMVFLICSIPAFLFLKNKSIRNSKMIEYASALWTALMYLSLGGIPMLIKMFS